MGGSGIIVGNGYSIAWRVLDAQYWGVPQRRKRIYLVADFAGQRAGEILFKREGLRRDFAPSREAREETAADAVGSTSEGCGIKCLNPWGCQSKRIYEPDGVYPTLPAMGDGARNNQAVVYALQGNGIDRADSAGCNGRGWRENICYTLNTIDRPAICFKAGQGARARSLGASETVSPTLGSEPGSDSIPAVCYDARGNGDGQIVPTITGDHQSRVTDYTALAVLLEKMRCYIVRRLTPLECCRLQGFPDWWEDCVVGSDTARYKMWGNGMALPCVLYVMEGIAAQCEVTENEMYIYER